MRVEDRTPNSSADNSESEELMLNRPRKKLAKEVDSLGVRL